MNLIGDIYQYVFQEPIFNLLMLIYGIVRSLPFAFAIAIILLTIVVRVCMIPLFMKQLKSQREMQVIGPEVQRIQREFRSEPMVMQKQLNALYKEHGVNPYAGCLPMLVQLPFLWGLYGGLRTVLGAHSSASWSKDLYPFIKPIYGNLLNNGSFHIDTNFLFGINLAKPDATHILPVLAAVLTFVSIRMAILKNRANQQAQSQPVVQNKPAGPDPNAASMKMMQYMMPIVTLISASVFQAGLAVYWATTTAFSIGQQYFVNGRNWGPIQNDVNMLLGFVGLGNRGKTTVVEEPAPQPRAIGRRRTVVDALPAKDDLKQPAPALLEAPANGNGNKPASAPKPRPVTPRPQPAKKTPAVRLASSANGATAGTPIKVATSANGAAVSVARAPKAPTVSRPKSTSAGRSSKSRKKK